MHLSDNINRKNDGFCSYYFTPLFFAIVITKERTIVAYYAIEKQSNGNSLDHQQ